MSYDGKALAKARETIRERKQKNESALLRRREEAYIIAPDLEAIERDMTQLMTGVALEALRKGSDAGAAVKRAQGRSAALLERRAALLKEKGLPETYLDETYGCEICRDTGYVRGEPCSCLETAYKDEMAKMLTSMLDLGQQSFERFDISLYEPVNPGEPTTELRNHISEIFKFCKGYANNFDERSKNLIFKGDTGLGKTFLSASIAKVVSEKGFSVVYDTCVAVLDAFETQKFDRGAENAAGLSSQIKRYLNCDLLILDDLGTEMTTAFTQSALYTLINSRLSGGKKTIISTNLSEEELKRRYSSQLISRLKGEYMSLQFTGRDIREVKKQRNF